MQFSTDKIHKVSKKLKPKFTRDLEGLPTYLVKQLITALPGPLSLLFNSFLSVGRIPSSWKKAIITPIYKKGPSSEPADNLYISIEIRATRSLTSYNHVKDRLHSWQPDPNRVAEDAGMASRIVRQ